MEVENDGGRDLLVPYFKASYPVLYLLTHEEARAEDEIVHAGSICNRADIKLWSCTNGLYDVRTKACNSDLDNPMKALDVILKAKEKNTVYIFRDLHRFFDQPKVLRLLRDIACQFRQGQKTLIIISPIGKIPPEIERDITLIEYKLPGRTQLNKVLDGLIEGNKALSKLDADHRHKTVEASLGLTTTEAENAMSKAVIEAKGEWDRVSQIVMREKAMMVKKTGILEYFETADQAQDVGGLGNLKKWLDERKEAFTQEARDFGLPSPRGCVLVGLPGCGKSLCAKVTANVMGVPLIRFDIGRVFAGLVGQSEQNMRTALQTIEAIGNCVVWVDEMEKAFAGAGSSQSGDSGVTQRVFGNFLTWMQERKGASFVVATVNRIASIPPELLRKGRVDEIFFVDLPDEAEREEILKIHIRKRKRDVEKVAKDEHFWKDCIKHSEGFSGAEIEEAVITGLYKAYHLDRKSKTKKDLQAIYIDSAIQNTVPVSKSQAENLKDMLQWATDNAVPASQREKLSDNQKLRRSLDI
jgi:ATP-dependent 26S proteasome regulatory subunit